LIDNKTKYLDADEASQWELVYPEDLVADCQWNCFSGNEFPNGYQEGPCGNQCGAGGYCCNGALNDDSPDAICTSDQRAPLLQHSPRIIHNVCVKPVEGTATNNGDDLVCVPDCGPNQTSVNGECECDAGFSPSGGLF